MSTNGEPRVSMHPVALPLALACKPRPALKTGLFKFTLDTELPAQPLTDIFDDFLYSYQEAGMDITETLGNAAAQAIGFQFWCGNNSDYSSSTSVNSQQPAVVSILVSKTAGRYRVQSDCLPAVLCIIAELDRRLSQRIYQIQNPTSDATGGRKPVSHSNLQPVVSCADNLPLDEYFALISIHFSTRQRLQDYLSQLNDGAHQFRMIEKRLLVRFKDRNPTALGGLDVLMKESYRKLLSLGMCVNLSFISIFF